MSYAIVYMSRTGNTAQLAECLRTILPEGEPVYFGPPADEAIHADILFVGSWTDRGTCCPEIAQFLNRLDNKRVYLFGTAGFGGSPAYFCQIGERMAQNLPADSTLLGCFLCQGKMPASVRARYETMAQSDPQKAAPLLENFDQALSHPDQADLAALRQAVTQLLSSSCSGSDKP